MPIKAKPMILSISSVLAILIPIWRTYSQRRINIF
jgi:hypothetical protein